MELSFFRVSDNKHVEKICPVKIVSNYRVMTVFELEVSLRDSHVSASWILILKVLFILSDVNADFTDIFNVDLSDNN